VRQAIIQGLVAISYVVAPLGAIAATIVLVNLLRRPPAPPLSAEPEGSIDAPGTSPTSASGPL